MKPGIVINWSRSGGTLLNRCIGVLPDVVVLSEVSPLRLQGGLREPITVHEQARQWYGIELSSEEFAAAARELYDICDSRGQRLVLRLWNVGEFRPSRQVHDPPNRFLSCDLLRGALGELNAVGFIRDSIDIWISNGCKRDFFRYYRRYIETLFELDVPVFRYEDFCADPDGQMEAICRALDIPYDPVYREFAAFERVRGDRRVAHSRGYRSSRIRDLPRRQIAGAHIRWLNRCADMKAANRIAGYAPTYFGAAREPWPLRVRAELRELRNVVRRVAGTG